MSTALIIRKPDLGISFTPEAETLKTEALEASALIGSVTNAAQQETAVQAAARIKNILDTIEKARKAAKEPLLEACHRLDSACKTFRVELENEWGRLIHDLVNPFQFAEKRRLDAEKAAQDAEIKRVEEEAQKKLAKAKTEEKRQEIAEQAAVQKAIIAQPLNATRAKGQVVTDDWEIEVTNPYELARWHPDCVEIKPKLTPIKALLNQGLTMKGIIARKVVKTSVRAPKRNGVIEI